MKKLFVAVLAIAALAACNKEEVPSFNDNEAKTIQISILNETDYTRAEGGDTLEGEARVCAANADLKVLFAKADGTIVYEDTLLTAADQDTTTDEHAGVGAAGQEKLYVKDADSSKYMWHNVPADVKQIAVVRYEAGDLAEGKTNFVGDNLSTLSTLASNEAANLAREIEDIVLYGVDDLYDTGATHRVGNTFFHVWQADVTVAPAFARFEIHSLACTDLGALNADGDPDTYDLDELLLKSLTWKSVENEEGYTAPGFGAQRLFGKYNPATGKVDTNNQTDPALRLNEYKPTNGAWSWNVKPCTFDGLTLDLDAYAYDYTLASRNLPLVVTGLAKSQANADNNTADGNSFEKGYIYTLDLTFTQANIKTADGICAVVTVIVEPWVVEKRYPVYQLK